jgi:mannose/fructose-specific phosphotransferase system component IIA
MHINKDLVKKGFPNLQRQKLIIAHESFAPDNLEACQKIFGSYFKEEHLRALRFASTADEITAITTAWQNTLSGGS